MCFFRLKHEKPPILKSTRARLDSRLSFYVGFVDCADVAANRSRASHGCVSLRRRHCIQFAHASFASAAATQAVRCSATLVVCSSGLMRHGLTPSSRRRPKSLPDATTRASCVCIVATKDAHRELISAHYDAVERDKTTVFVLAKADSTGAGLTLPARPACSRRANRPSGLPP